MIGSQISNYTILEKLGEGGMGVVYRARDTKLDRDVALKFLPAHLAASEADRARFMQEAKAAASLDHPNICTIFGMGEYDPGGPSGSGASQPGGTGPQLFFAMSYVEGSTLREKIPALSAKQAIDIAIQIADGLASAHEKGVVHRDIKPENIMIRKDGIVQIMDFGLARLRDSSSRVNRLTMAGSTVGTAGYMSPEQVQGQDADHRSDIFSLGVLLYEMLTGALPFKGVHQTALAYEIVNVDPQPVSLAKPGLDPNLDALVYECLSKDPAERFQSAAELAKELRRYKRESGRSRVSTISRTGMMTSGGAAIGGGAPAGGGPRNVTGEYAGGATGRSTRRISMERYLWIGALAAAAGVILYLLLGRPSEENAPPIPVRFTVAPPESTIIEGTAVSPNGRTLAFTATGRGLTRLWLRPLTSLGAQPVAGTEDAQFPFWSPDGRFIGFFAGGKMKRYAIDGGSPLEICDAPDPAGATWNTAGDILFARWNAGIFRVAASGGPARQVLRPDSGEGGLIWPVFLPDGNHFLFTGFGVFDDKATTYIGSLDDTTRSALVTSEANVAFVAPSSILFLNNRTLMLQRIDLDGKRLTGDPAPVTVDVGMVPRFIRGDFSYSPAGVLVTGTGRSVNRRYSWFDRTGKDLGAVCPPGNYFDIALSPAGDRAAVQRVDLQTGNSDIWIVDLARALVTRFTFDAAVDDDPVWSPDGRYVFYSNTSSTTYNIFRKNASGTGAPEMMLEPGDSRLPTSWAPDGSRLLFDVRNDVNQTDIWSMPADGSSAPAPLISTQFDEFSGQYSPDGRWIAYTSYESGRAEVYVQDAAAGGGRWQVSTDGGARPRWRPDGGELFYVSPSLEMMSVEVRPGASFEYGVARPLFITRIDTYTGPNRYVVSKDGSKFLINVPVEEARVNHVTVSIRPFE